MAIISPFCQTYITATSQVRFQTTTVWHTIQPLTYKWEEEKKRWWPK